MDMIVDCAGYEQGRRVCSLDITAVRDWIADHDRFVWVGLHEPDQDLLRTVQKQFGLHDLAMEDALKAHQRPKLEFYGDSLFLVLHTAQHINGKVQYGETHVFCGRGYIISVRHGVSSSYSEVRTRCELSANMLRKGADFVLYSLMDFVVDNYQPIIEQFEAEASQIEETVLSRLIDREAVTHVYELKRHLLHMRGMVSPLVEICNRLSRFDSSLIDEDMRPYFRDVQDHAIRVDETIDTLRENLGSALEANLLLASVQQNEVMKKLAGYAAMLAVPTAIAGIYGMNFSFMPELNWRYGYFTVIGVMVGVCSYLYYRFKKAGWF